MVDDVNCCCPHFVLLECHDTEEHFHIGCDPKSGLDDNPIISNGHAKVWCLSEGFNGCPYYPKGDG